MKYMSLINSLLLLLSINLFADETYSTNKKGNSLYNSKQYEEALQQYDDAILLSPSDVRLKMNKGSAHYQLGEYEKAEEAYTSALSSDDKELMADAHYNMGNILFKHGAQLYQSGQPQAQEKFKSALEHYIQSLDLRPDDNDTKWNLQLAHQVLKQLEQQQQEQQDDKNDDKNKDKNEQDSKQNKKDQNKDKEQQDKQEQQDNKQDDEKTEEQQQQEESKQDQQEENEQKQSEMNEQEEEDLKKEEAMRILEMFADDADSLNKPLKSKSAQIKQPQQDW